jgi:hypothetical protein
MPLGKNHKYCKIFETLMGALSTQNQGSEVDLRNLQPYGCILDKQ